MKRHKQFTPEWQNVYDFDEPVTNMAVLTEFKPRWWELWRHSVQALYVTTTSKGGKKFTLYKLVEGKAIKENK